MLLRTFVGLCALSCSAVSADWLSLKDGQLLETKGAWTEKGKMIVYTDPTGHLLSIRATEVDLEVSKEIGKRIVKAKYKELDTPIDPDYATDVSDEREAQERAKLQKHVTDPNSVKVSGTLSAQSDTASEEIINRELEADEAGQAYRSALAGCQSYAAEKREVCILRARIVSDREAAEKAKNAPPEE